MIAELMSLSIREIIATIFLLVGLLFVAISAIGVIRLPDFVSEADFDWAVQTATQKKKIDCSSAEFLTVEEGLCVQIMHLGSFDDEPKTVALMDAYLEQNGYVNDMNEHRLHHEIYMSDARKVPPEKWKTVIRHPIRTVERTKE